jgi:hypothetical protein
MTTRQTLAAVVMALLAAECRPGAKLRASDMARMAGQVADLGGDSPDLAVGVSDGGADASIADGGSDGGNVCLQPALPDAGLSTIVVDGTSAGRTFDFVGGLSGGGATSRLLIDYPPQQQKEILDYLFKPQFGASLQMLKVEIGADTDTTNGAEASHQRTPTDQNYHRGYEWWLMQEAKKRNPNIKLYGLEWGAPGWFASGFFSDDNINYIINWISHASSDYGLTIDYVGCRNEMSCDKAWLERLKAALSSHGLQTQVVAADQAFTWSVAVDLQMDTAYNAAVDVVGVHYPCGYLKDGSDCGALPDLAQALMLGKRLWASEQGSQRFDSGAVPMARGYNRGYIQAKITGSINWSLVGAWYTNLPFGGVDGLLAANQPWSGHYVVDKEIWTTAHLTQFVQPGWRYLDTGSALVPGVGSYVSLRAPKGTDWTAIIETTDAKSDTTFNIVETGGVSAGPVHVWATDLSSTNTKDWFVQQPDIAPANCQLAFVAAPNHVYTLSTMSGAAKGATTPPPAATWALPYQDDFESYQVGGMPNIPKYLSAVEGAFETEKCAAGRSGICVQQEITTAPDSWKGNPVNNPLAFIGDPGWTDYKVSADVLLPQSGSVEVIGRIAGVNSKGGGAKGYHVQVSDAGAWSLYRQDAASQTVLASGTVSFPLKSWHTLALGFAGSKISALYDGTILATVTDTTYAKGNAGVSSSKWIKAQLDNLAITATGP